MFKGFHTYSVYVKQDSREPLDTALFVREGFSLWAMLFNLFWVMYHRLWALSGLLLIFYAFTALMRLQGGVPEAVPAILNLGAGLWLGFEASDLKGQSLKKRGYLLYDVVRGMDEEEATARFIQGVAA